MEANYFTILYWFCHTSTWIRHRCTHVPHPEPRSHLPPHLMFILSFPFCLETEKVVLAKVNFPSLVEESLWLVVKMVMMVGLMVGTGLVRVHHLPPFFWATAHPFLNFPSSLLLHSHLRIFSFWHLCCVFLNSTYNCPCPQHSGHQAALGPTLGSVTRVLSGAQHPSF